MEQRVVPDFCQTGDPTGTCTGGESIYGKFFDDEISAKVGTIYLGMTDKSNSLL